MTDHITTANAIKAEIAACQTAEEVEAVSDKHRPTVQAMAKSKARDATAMAHQIAHKKAQRLWEIEEIERNGK